jgi:UDPglucose 6-dehydrogenase
MNVKKIAIVGSGVVGRATGKGLAALGHDVIFSDINLLVLERLGKEGFKSCNIDNPEKLCADDREVFMVSVLTPTIDEHIDLRFLESSMVSLGGIIKKKNDYPLVVIRSTTPPGTIEETLIPHLEKFSGKKAGVDFGVAMNPEFLREATAEKDFLEPWLIVVGSDDPRSAEIMEEVYAPLRGKSPIVHMSLKEAEMMKYVHNIYNANKISFFNEMRQIAELKGIDADKVFKTVVQSAEGSWNKEYGIKNKGPFGGSCLPKDTRAFLYWAQYALHKKLPLLHATIRVNENLKDRLYLEE